MLEVLGKRISCCDGIDRRGFLRVGTLGLGGLSLPALLAHRAAAARRGGSLRPTSVIYVELAGRTIFRADVARGLIEEMRESMDVIQEKGTFASDARRDAVLGVYREGIAELERRMKQAEE